ncbi:hypothetical protein [Nocardia sp. Marseille-Q1738]
MSPQAPRRHQAPTVSPSTAQLGGGAGHQDSTDRDALKAILDAELEVQGHAILGLGYFLAGAAVQAGWRPPAQAIETAEELDALQSAQGLVDDERCGHVASAAVIRDADGDVYARDVDNVLDEVREGRHAGWWQIGTGRDDIDSSTLTYPVTVLWTPENGDIE